jgi:hypothetical protein
MKRKSKAHKGSDPRSKPAKNQTHTDQARSGRDRIVEKLAEKLIKTVSIKLKDRRASTVRILRKYVCELLNGPEGELLIDMEEALADGSPAAIRAVVDKMLD